VGPTSAAILLAKVAVIELLLAQHRPNASILDLDGAKPGYSFFNPIGLIILVVGTGAAFRTANGERRTGRCRPDRAPRDSPRNLRPGNGETAKAEVPDVRSSE
jgi:hypothetical protein